MRDRVVARRGRRGLRVATDAALVGDRVRVAFGVPTVRPIRYSAAIVRASREEAAARAFVEYLRGPPAREVFAYYGFTGHDVNGCPRAEQGGRGTGVRPRRAGARIG